MQLITNIYPELIEKNRFSIKIKSIKHIIRLLEKDDSRIKRIDIKKTTIKNTLESINCQDVRWSKTLKKWLSRKCKRTLKIIQINNQKWLVATYRKHGVGHADVIGMYLN